MVVTPNAAAARVDHTYLKRGVYYFNWRVPLDVSRHYKSRRINFSLRTKSVRAARQSVTAITAQLEGYWQHLRLRDASVPGAHLLYAANDEPADDGSLRFSEATDLYLRLKGQGKAEPLYRAAARVPGGRRDRRRRMSAGPDRRRRGCRGIGRRLTAARH